jgi:heme-degrading monooxygenase HmoA
MANEHAVIRMWRGAVRTGDRDSYVDYLVRTGLREYRETPGNLDAWLLTRELDDGVTEIVTMSKWESLAAIEGFAGEDIQRAVFYPEDDAYLVERDLSVSHYSVRA